MRGKLAQEASRADLAANPAPAGRCATSEQRAPEPLLALRFPYEAPAVVDHGPLADLTWARFTGLAARLGRRAPDSD